jgi:hypothetical protein
MILGGCAALRSFSSIGSRGLFTSSTSSLQLSPSFSNSFHFSAAFPRTPSVSVCSTPSSFFSSTGSFLFSPSLLLLFSPSLLFSPFLSFSFSLLLSFLSFLSCMPGSVRGIEEFFAPQITGKKGEKVPHGFISLFLHDTQETKREYREIETKNTSEESRKERKS